MTSKPSKPALDLTPSPVALATALVSATDEIREQFRPPANTLFLHEKQMEVYTSPHRFKVVVAGRRWGKTQLAKISLIKYARRPRRLIWYVAPSYRMAKQIMWPDLVEAIPRSWVRKYNETILTITLVNGSRIELKGADNPDCYDAQTEILTEKGWVNFANLPKTDRVLTLNPATLSAEWKQPYKYVDQEYEGPMYRIASGKLDLLVTPEHKFLVKNRKGVTKFRPIEEISEHQDRIPARCGWEGTDIPAMTNDMCAIAGFYLAEGCAYGVSGGDRTNRGWPVFFSQTEGIKGGLKGDVRAQFSEVLTRAGYKFRNTKIGMNVQNRELYELLFPLGNKYTKRIPREWLDLPQDKLKTMLHWLVMGDGVWREGDVQYYSVSRGLADDVQELAIKAGYSALIVEKKQTDCVIDGRLIQATVPLWEVKIHHSEFNYFRDSKESYVSHEEYSGRVYCVGVENHTVMVRRNGKICWSGNTLRGVGIHYLVMDEVQDITPDAWKKVLRPTLASTGGHALFIGTPKAYNVLYDLWSTGQKESAKAWASWQFPTITSPFIPPEEIEAARADMDEKSFKQEFEASFETMSGRVYYPFERKEHVKPLTFDPTLPIWIGQDFNIDPMSSVVFQRQKNGELWAVDEICLPNSNTQELCDELERRYWRYLDQIVIYPDPAGAYGSTKGRGESDLDIFRVRGFKKQKYHRKHPAVADRVNSVNRLLRSANGSIRMFIDPRCKKLIEAFEQTLYTPGSREVDKKAGVEHAADAAGYCVEFEYPVRKIEIMGVSI